MRFWFFLVTFIFPLGLLYANEPQSYCSMNRVCVDFVPSRNGVDVYFQNKIATSATETSLLVDAIVKNMKSSKPLPILTILKGNKRKKLFQFKATQSLKKASYKIQYKWILGNYKVTHNSHYIYELPFDPKLKVRVFQGYHGKKTHTGDNRFSIDFGLKEDDLITAARPGTVIDTEEKNNEGGFDPKFKQSANFVKILHEDGTIAEYAHLRYMGVLVKRGQHVGTGTQLGYAGSTGYSEGPHLHFEVYQPTKSLRKKTIPTKFRTQSADSEYLSEGALVWRRESFVPSEKKLVDVDQIHLCDNIDIVAAVNCNQTGFSKLSPIYITLPILRPDVYSFQLNLRKKDSSMIYEYTWESKKEDWMSSFMIPIQDFQEPLEGDWIVSVSVNQNFQKKIEFQITSLK
ncbi:Metalloendopeptidase [Leptospira biflexa serovar Patoc strain 'Patoc 1 (Ames)']|uniref:Putative peptidase, M23B family putative signal peptide n=2 Tax=Leptospira biflexa TaxID=172 RepID=B0SKS6_LEPBP|nr:M23 family metallopeptidase [Leptospira biflexa]ABZ93210.1 Metalloendopeptidase [Leptospira biflexa serovar Patoc strain 'Patoc 1 (Ames)']ABZ96833.1 Putative peptidase, M23B family; putative signal peptide [Leptospira biflexa serovar Patoc strain 'Patoc 1 (Paris)']